MEIICYEPPIEWVKEKIEEAGTTIGSVHFQKRSGKKELRKMSYRLHVTNPSVASTPKGYISSKKQLTKKEIDKKNSQMTVFDANKVIRDSEGKIKGRGAWRTVPLENVVRISNRGNTYIIKKYSE